MNKKNNTIIGLASAFLSVGLLGSSMLGTAFAQTNNVSTNLNPTNIQAIRADLFKNVERKVENLTNGIKMTMTSTDSATVTKLQERKQPETKNSKVTVTKTNLTNGVEITMTSSDAATVTKLQARPAKMEGKFGHRGGIGLEKNVERKMENLTNGIKMTMTSTDSATVTKLQERKQPETKNSKVTVTKTNLTNGVEITMTSSDAEIVKKIQQGPKSKGRVGNGKLRPEVNTTSQQ